MANDVRDALLAPGGTADGRIAFVVCRNDEERLFVEKAATQGILDGGTHGAPTVVVPADSDRLIDYVCERAALSIFPRWSPRSPPTRWRNGRSRRRLSDVMVLIRAEIDRVFGAEAQVGSLKHVGTRMGRRTSLAVHAAYQSCFRRWPMLPSRNRSR